MLIAIVIIVVEVVLVLVLESSIFLLDSSVAKYRDLQDRTHLEQKQKRQQE